MNDQRRSVRPGAPPLPRTGIDTFIRVGRVPPAAAFSTWAARRVKPALQELGAPLLPGVRDELRDRSNIRGISLVGMMFLMLSGATACRMPTPPDGLTAAEIAEPQLDRLWDSALSVLRKHDFQPVRQDRALGIIETTPTTSMQWYELWRQDVASAYDLFEASLHTTQRKATVRFLRGDREAEEAGNAWTVTVQVGVYRLSREETQITSASSVLHGFTGGLPTARGQESSSDTSQDRWIYERRDGAVEQRLLRRILAEAEAG